ncbi:1-acyl-sn-glycerol-3-phosphate acyltransferase 3, partial [Diplonema papillatum]
MAESTPLQRLAQTGLFLPFIAVTWLCGGLITNVLQLLNFMLVFPFSRRLYTIINGYLVWWWWLTIIWAFDWWAEWDVRFFCPNGDFDVKRQENTIVLGNHYGDVDWMIGWLLAERHGTLGHAKSYMKSFTKYLPILGWSWYFADYVFLDRSWNKDESTL